MIHLGSLEQGAAMLAQAGLSNTDQISDPDRRLYRTLELPFATLGQLFSVQTFWRAVVEGVVFRFGFGSFVGHGLQMSGAFVIKNGRIERAVRHDSPAERTDFKGLSCDIA